MTEPTTKAMRRHGKTLKVLRDGHPRRMSDGRNAWRKMSDAQRAEFMQWLSDNGAEGVGDAR